MAFFDNLGKKISDVSQSTIQKGKELADAAKYNSLVSDEEKKITGVYTQIGKLYAELYMDSPEETFAEYIESIKTSKSLIEEYQQKLKDLKGVSRCTNCGAEVPNGSFFCAVCGTKIAEPVQEVVVEPAQDEVKEETQEVIAEQEQEAPAEPEITYCIYCGGVLPQGTKFCAQCGKPVNVEPVTI